VSRPGVLSLMHRQSKMLEHISCKLVWLSINLCLAEGFQTLEQGAQAPAWEVSRDEESQGGDGKHSSSSSSSSSSRQQQRQQQGLMA